MLSLEVNKRVKGNPEDIWQILIDENSFAEAAPNVTRVEHISGNGLNMVRYVHHNSGRSWEETCIDWKEKSRFTMRANSEDYPLAVTNMRRITIMERIKNSWVIKIRYEYTPRYGPLGLLLDKYQIRPILKIFVIQLIDNLAKKINQQTTTTITAATILADKPPGLFFITPETSVSDACDMLTKKRIGCVMVLNEKQDIAGILSERDIVNGISNSEKSIMNSPVKDFMTQNVITAKPEDSLEMIMSCMSKHRFRHLPVVDHDNKLSGVISIGDVVNSRMSQLENESNVMQQYIEGRKWREMTLEVGHDTTAKELR